MVFCSHNEWFTRGWTLRELTAPRHIQFCTRDWRLIGSTVSPRSCSDDRYPHTDPSLTLWIVLTTSQYCPNYAMGRQSCRHHACRRPGLSSDRFIQRVHARLIWRREACTQTTSTRNHADVQRSEHLCLGQTTSHWWHAADSPSFFTGLSDVRTTDPEQFVQ